MFCAGSEGTIRYLSTRVYLATIFLYFVLLKLFYCVLFGQCVCVCVCVSVCSVYVFVHACVRVFD